MAAKKTSSRPATKKAGAKTKKKRTATRRRQTATFKLPEQCRIGQTQSMKPELKNLLDVQKQVTIDGSKVEKIDTSVMQLLTAFVIRARTKSINIKWNKPSRPLCDAARLLGLEQTLELSTSATGKNKRPQETNHGT